MPRSSGVAPSHLPRWAKTRRHPRAASGGARGTEWRFRRAVDRVEPALTSVLVQHAIGYWGRPFARHELAGRSVPCVVWTIEGQPVVELRVAERGPSSLVVHDFSLHEPLRRAIRTRHVRIRLATVRDLAG